MRIDLHSHSTCSDGKLSPAELVARAVEKEVDVLALTDHDTIDGIALAQTAIHENNLPLFLVPGWKYLVPGTLSKFMSLGWILILRTER